MFKKQFEKYFHAGDLRLVGGRGGTKSCSDFQSSVWPARIFPGKVYIVARMMMIIVRIIMMIFRKIMMIFRIIMMIVRIIMMTQKIIFRIIMMTQKMILPRETAASSRDSVSITLFFVMYWIVCKRRFCVFWWCTELSEKDVFIMVVIVWAVRRMFFDVFMMNSMKIVMIVTSVRDPRVPLMVTLLWWKDTMLHKKDVFINKLFSNFP